PQMGGFRGGRANPAAGEDADRTADDADHPAQQGTAAGSPVTRLRELDLAVGPDLEQGGVAELLREGAPAPPRPPRAAVEGLEARCQDLAGRVSHRALLPIRVE